jgi:hypothetical protein
MDTLTLIFIRCQTTIHQDICPGREAWRHVQGRNGLNSERGYAIFDNVTNCNCKVLSQASTHFESCHLPELIDCGKPIADLF